jgi:hypothetical protein
MPLAGLMTNPRSLRECAWAVFYSRVYTDSSLIVVRNGQPCRSEIFGRQHIVCESPEIPLPYTQKDSCATQTTHFLNPTQPFPSTRAAGHTTPLVLYRHRDERAFDEGAAQVFERLQDRFHTTRPSFSESEPTSFLSPLRLLLSEANKGRGDRRTVEGDIVGRHVYNGAILAGNEASMEYEDILCG